MQQHAESAGRRDPWPTVAAAAVLLAYVAVAWSMPKHVFWAPDEGGRFLQINSIQWSNGFTFALPYQGHERDPSLRFYPRDVYRDQPMATYPAPGPDGGVQFHWPITFSLAVWPLWTALGYPGLVVVPLLAAWLTALLTGHLAGCFDKRLRAAAIVLSGLATPLFFYSQTLWDHSLATMLGLVAAVVIVKRPPTLRTAAIAAVPLTGAMMVRLELLAFAAAAVVTMVLARRHSDSRPDVPSMRAAVPWRSLLLAAALLTAALAAFYFTLPSRHQRFFSAAWATFPGLRRIIQLPIGARELLINSGSNEGPVPAPIEEMLTLFGVVAIAVGPWLRSTRSAAVFLIGNAVLFLYSAKLQLSPLIYRSLHGLLPIAPYVAFAAAAVPLLRQRIAPQLRKLLLLTIAYLTFGLGVNYLAYSSPVDAKLWNTLEWGPRYVLTAYPLLVVLALLGYRSVQAGSWQALAKTVATIIAAGMVWIAGQQQIRGLQMLYENRVLFTSWHNALPADLPVVTDIWWAPATLAGYYVSHEVYYVPDRFSLGLWIDTMAAQGVRQFVYARLKQGTPLTPPEPERVEQAAAIDVNGLMLTTFRLVPRP